MDIKKPSKKSAIETASLIGGAAGGAMLSEGVLSLIHDPAKELGADGLPIKGADTARRLKHLAIIATGSALAAFVPGNDVASMLVKGAGIGMAVKQAANLVADYAKSNQKAQTLRTGSKAQRFLSKTLGMGCPSDFGNNDQYALQGVRRTRRRSLNAPEQMFIPEIMSQQVGLENLY